jgi:hypothetical protein
LNNLALVALGQGNYAEARALYRESLALRRVLKNTSGIAACLAGLGAAAIGEKHVARGVRLIGSAEGQLEPIGFVLDRQDRIPYEQSVTQARAMLGEHEFELARQEGQAMSMEQAIEYALEQPSTE